MLHFIAWNAHKIENFLTEIIYWVSLCLKQEEVHRAAVSGNLDAPEGVNEPFFSCKWMEYDFVISFFRRFWCHHASNRLSQSYWMAWTGPSFARILNRRRIPLCWRWKSMFSTFDFEMKSERILNFVSHFPVYL